ncbi:MAG: hypothetical protein MUC88_00400 [Planctomycetes bacterium]|jgi:hypothetical protein|nr:hypothetical protein [Planctomycetota bacterium]
MLPIIPHVDWDCGPTEPTAAPAILPPHWQRRDAFSYTYRDGLAVILSEALERDGNRWRHVSVSARGRLPTWDELVAVKEIFLGTDSCAVQVLPPRREWVNHHPNVLHLFVRVDQRAVPDFRRGGTL